MKRKTTLPIALAALVSGLGIATLFVEPLVPGASAQMATATSSASAQAMAVQTQNPCNTEGEDPDIDTTERDVNHEMGHVLWGQLSQDDRDLWTEIWEMTKGTESELWQTDHRPGANPKNYYCANAMEGFCVAFSYMQCGVDIPGVISGFINTVGK